MSKISKENSSADWMRYKAGVTLIELLVTIAIVAILATLAVPSFTQIIKDNRLATATNELVATLHFARMEAIRQGKRVTICKSSNGQDCCRDDPSCDASKGWEQGWIVFVDEDNSGTRESGESLLRVREALEGTTKITGNHNVKNYISFLPTGESPTNGTLTVCDDRTGAYGRQIVISPTGRVRLVDKVSCP